MALVRDVDSQELIKRTADALQKELKPPEWASIVKTGRHKERPPTQENWWWIRAASILRKIYLKQNLGVSKFRKIYGGRKNKGHKPEHKYKASGKIIRKVLQDMEALEYIKTEKGKGRVITPKGQKFLNSVAKTIK